MQTTVLLFLRGTTSHLPISHTLFYTLTRFQKGKLNYSLFTQTRTREKMEINKQKAFNPIVQDIKKGVLRKFTYGDIPFNYGAIPQTWEDTEGHDVVMNGTPLHGDNDPLDVVEIGATPLEMGHVYRTKILGCLALVDEGELDWKLIGVNENDPLFNTLRDIQDLKQSNPELLAKIIDWFKMYKTTDGKGENQFALNGEVMDAKYAKHVIENTHNSWKDLIKNGREGIWTKI